MGRLLEVIDNTIGSVSTLDDILLVLGIAAVFGFTSLVFRAR